MACNSRSSCGPDFEQMRLWLKGIILELLNDGTLQAGLKDCEGEWLGKGRGVVLCDALADLLCDLINEGKLCVPKIAGFTADCDNKTLTITMADGTELTADASCFGGSGADGNTKIQSLTYDPQTGVVKIVDTENREFEVTIAVKDTKNKAMAWEPEKQEVSVTDTDDNKVSTVVTFPVAERPPVSQGPAPTSFIGKSGELFLGEPAVWMRMLLPDGRVGRMPVFLEDQIIRACVPYQYVHPKTGDPQPIYVTNNVYKTGDSLISWATRVGAMPQFTLDYNPDTLSPDQWKNFATQIKDWLEQNEGPNINPADYQVVMPIIGFVPFHYLLELDTIGVFGTRKYYHAFSDTEPLQLYAHDAPDAYGIGKDGNVYFPPNAECGFTLEPTTDSPERMWVSLTYATVTSGFATEFVTSQKVFLDQDVPQAVRLAGGLWNAIIATAIQIQTDLFLTWIAHDTPAGYPNSDGRSYVAAINTPFGTLNVREIFDFDRFDSQAHTEKSFIEDAMATKGVSSGPNLATKFPFYKQDEIVVEEIPNTNYDGKRVKTLNFDQAKKNVLHLFSQTEGDGLEYTFISNVSTGVEPEQAYFGIQ